MARGDVTDAIAPQRRIPRVEVVGPPGAGKSTTFAALLGAGLDDRRALLLDALRTAATDRLVRTVARTLPRSAAERRAYDLFYRSRDFQRSLFRFGAAHEQLYRLSSELTLDHPAPKARTWRLLQKHASVQATYQFLVESDVQRRGAELLDEEFVQMLLLGAANSRHHRRTAIVRDYVAAAPLPDVVVAVRADAELCASRVRARGTAGAWPLIIASSDGVDFLQRVDLVYGEVIDAVRSGGCTVIEVDGATPLNATALAATVRDAVEAAGSVSRLSA